MRRYLLPYTKKDFDLGIIVYSILILIKINMYIERAKQYGSV